MDKDYMLNRIATSQLVGEFVEKLNKDYEASDGFIEAQKTLNLVRASHILLETEEEAQEVKALIEEEPSRFEMLAAERSTCPSAENEGDLGYFESEAMVAEFSQAAFAMEIDEISDIVESQFGYHIIKVTDKGTLFELTENDLEDPSLEETKQRLIEAAVWEEFYRLYEEQVVKTPIQYYSLEN
ncbi:MAG TPA: peptidylprolyl isomerase [Clostridia bacterium]|nr:peptidylprolyl isomerase [Clostridia bacterium]